MDPNLKKRKRGPSSGKSIPVIDIGDDDYVEIMEPAVKCVKKDPGSLPKPVSSGNPKPGPSSSAASAPANNSKKNGSDSEHEFRVPVGPAIRNSNSRPQPRRKDQNVELHPPTVTPEQLRQTNSCRQMRTAVVGVIADVHSEIQRLGKPSLSNVGELLDNLWTCWKKYPLMFATNSRVPKLFDEEDLSNPSKIRDFMKWWLHGLASLLLVNELQHCILDVMNLLRTFASFLNYGNPNLVEECFVEILEVIYKLVNSISSSRTGLANVPLEFGGSENDQGKREIVIQYKLVGDDNVICPLFEVLLLFLPRVFYYQMSPRENFLKILNQIWSRFDEVCRFKLLTSFILPTLPLIQVRTPPTELSLVQFLSGVITDGTRILDSQSISCFQQFCSAVLSGRLSWNVFPQTLVLRLHSFLSKLIASDSYGAFPSDAHREAITQLYWSLTHERLKEDDGKKIMERDVQTFERASKTLTSFRDIHPLLENLIFEKLKESFTTEQEMQILELREEARLPPNRRPKMSILLQSESLCPIWGKIANTGITYTVDMKNFPNALEILRKQCFIIQFASRINRRLMEYVIGANQESKWVFSNPDFQLLISQNMVLWTELVGKFVVELFSGTSARPEADEVLSLIVNTMTAYADGQFSSIQLSLDTKCQWVAIAGLPWFHKFKYRLSKTYLPSGFLSGVKPSAIESLNPSTKAECLKTLNLPMIMCFKDFVIDAVSSEMGNKAKPHPEIGYAVLDMIHQDTWLVRTFPWKYLVVYCHRVLTLSDWSTDTKMRNKLVSSLIKLPCIITNQKIQKIHEESEDSNSECRQQEFLQLTFARCGFCVAEDDFEYRCRSIETAECVSEAELTLVLKLALPILRSRFKLAKMDLSKLITAARKHSKEYHSHLISEFTTAIANGKPCVGLEIMKNFSYYFAIPSQSLSSIRQNYNYLNEVNAERIEGIKLMINTLLYFLQKSLGNLASLRFSNKMLIVLKELACADLALTVEILKYSLRLIMPRDNVCTNMLSQSLCTALASKFSCLPWELMVRLRYDLSPTIISLIREEFCDFTEHSQEVQSERLRGFLSSIKNMGDFRLPSIFTYYYYPILLGEVVPSLHVDKAYQFILEVMGEFASSSSTQILQDGIHNYNRALVLNYASDRISKCFAFLKDRFNLDAKFLASTLIQGTLDEMLCYLNERKDKIMKFIPLLFEPGNADFVGVNQNPNRSDIQKHLTKHLMGFFVHVDSKLHSNLESVVTKRRILQSFTVLIEYMGKTRMTQHRSKVYATLNSLFSLGPEFYDLLLEAWKCYAHTLENIAFGQMSAQILAAILTLHDYLPQQVEQLITFFIHTKQDLTAQYYQELYFVLDFTSDPRAQKIIHDSVARIRSKGQGEEYLELLVRESRHENSHIRSRAIQSVYEVLRGERSRVHEIVEREHPVVAQMITSFISALRDADTKMLALLAESFGLLGAVDPYKLKQDGELAKKSAPVLTVDKPLFAVMYLNLLIREFQESDDTKAFDFCACLIQRLLQHFSVKAEETDFVWRAMSSAARESIEPLLTSHYKMEAKPEKVDMDSLIYNSKLLSFEQWLSRWLSAMALSIKPTQNLKEFDLFQFSLPVVGMNSRIASFLLPYVTTYAVMRGTVKQRGQIVKEITTILDTWIEQSARADERTPTKESQTELDTPEPVTKQLFFDKHLILYRCTQEVFSVFDHLSRVSRQALKQLALTKVNKGQAGRVRQINNDIEAPCVTEEDANTVNRVLAEIPMNTMSKVAFHCEDYKRALFYAEQDLKQYPEKLQDRLIHLQQLYVSLNDMDSVVGVAAVRKRDQTMNEVVCESFAKGKVEAGVRSLELMVREDPDDLIATSGLLQAYLSLDEPRKAETLIKGCISRKPHWEVALSEFQMDAAWKLRDWSKLSSATPPETKAKLCNLSNVITLSPTPKEELIIDINPSSNQTQWTTAIIKILSSIQTSELETALKMTNESRLKLISPLVAAANDNNAYYRGYSNIVQLHILAEVEQIIKLIKDGEHLLLDFAQKVKNLIQDWSSRDNILLKSQKFVDPVLNVRKSLLEILKDIVRPQGSTLESIDGSIRDCWLTAARVESKAGNFTRAHNCILEAKKYKSAQVLIEHAKLLSRKGEKEQALEILANGIPSYFPRVEEYKLPANISVVEYSLERQLCSQAMLLHAKLCDQLQRLDIDKNIINYQSCINCFKYSEKNYFALAGYFDRIFSNAKPEEKVFHSGTQEKIVRYYALSLSYGCKYVYQSLPRLLSIWFDYAALQNQPSPGFNPYLMSGSANSSTSSSESLPQPVDWSQTCDSMATTIRNLRKEVPAYVLLTAYSQLLSRLCHANTKVWDLLKEILVSLICTHPHQTLWMTMAVSKSSYDMRRRRCMEIYKSVEKVKPGLKKTIQDYTLLAEKLIELCIKEVDKDRNKVSLTKLCPGLPKLIQNPSFGDVLVPVQVFMTPSLPPSGIGHKGYDAFPQRFVFIKGVEDQVDVMTSVVRPKKISLIGSDGKHYDILCKPKDDLRKDCKVMEVNNVINWYLYRNPESRQRQLHIRIYSVTPLNEEHGLLEWVPNLGAYRTQIINLLKERGVILNMRDLRNLSKRNDTLQEKRHKFETKCILPHPPVFSKWFLNNFNDPQSWYKARMSYVRTAAVMSIVGFIFGLGDRHGENICLDSSTGDIVHVDFNCLFNRGESFDIPERVPFRLTQNMVEAMGPLGVDGVYRRSCEITMNLIRQHKDVFLSVLRPFVYDPLVEWGNSLKMFNASGEVNNLKAVEHMKHITNRINGSARNCTKDVNTELSIEAQVEYLIKEARNVDNLCQMFIGWTAFL